MKLLVPVALAASAGLVCGQDSNVERLKRAAEVFQEIMQTPDRSIPQQLLDKAHCVVVIPSLKKAGFGFGGKYGRGFVSCRAQGNVGWSGPAAVRVEGASFGLQIGASATDVMMLVMNERGADRLLSSQFTLGGDASVAAGPVGRDATAQTDALLTAEILSWSRSRGVFAGVTLSGATMRQDLDTNTAIYGKRLENREIIRGNVPPPAPAAAFLEVLNKHSSRGS